jgi:hypothetical protein
MVKTRKNRLSKSNSHLINVKDSIIVVEEGETHDPEPVIGRELKMHDSEYTLIVHERYVIVLCYVVGTIVDID